MTADLIRALEFYSDPADYKAPFTGGMGALYFDCGAKAREAIAAHRHQSPAEHTPADQNIEAAVDTELGIKLLPPIRVPAATAALIEKFAALEGVIVQSVVRDVLVERFSAQAPAEAHGFDAAGFRAWVLANLPGGSVIQSGDWWAGRLTEVAGKFVKPAQPQPKHTSDKANEWRKLAQQFDGQRMAAMVHLRTLLAFPDAHADAVRAFLAATPAEQIGSVQPAQAPAPVAVAEKMARTLADFLGAWGTNGDKWSFGAGFAIADGASAALAAYKAPVPAPVPAGFVLFPAAARSDVLTAAGLVRHGKQCKALADRLGEAVAASWDAGLSAPAPAVGAEREQLRAAQVAAVMPLIGPLLDAWEQADREVMDEEPELVKWLKAINTAMETAGEAEL